MTDDDNGVFVPPKETFTVKARVCFRDDIDAKAREIVKAGFYSTGDVDPHGISKDGEKWLTEAIAAALLSARNEALEEAAKAIRALRRP